MATLTPLAQIRKVIINKSWILFFHSPTTTPVSLLKSGSCGLQFKNKMIKRTLYFGNPAYLKTKDEQLVIEMHDSGETKTAPIEDIGIIILDHQQITITQSVLAKLLASNTAIITCDDSHHPIGLQLTLDGHTLQSQKFKAQIETSLPLKKQLWQQTITAKINNQATLLQQERVEAKHLLNLARNVKSGDSDNCEAQAAVYYWKNIFPEFLHFRRERYGPPPNNLLNYGYAILRQW